MVLKQTHQRFPVLLLLPLLLHDIISNMATASCLATAQSKKKAQ